MERKFLEGLNLEKETVDKIMAEHGKTVEKEKAKTTAVTTERDELKTQLDDFGKKLDAFKDVDPDALNKQIADLKGELAQKDEDYKAQLADKDFQAAVNAQIAAAKGKNPKAIIALLDVEKLKSSKNQEKDIAAAFTALRESDAYLFDADDAGTGAAAGTEATPPAGAAAGTPAQVSTGGKHNGDGSGTPPDTNSIMNAQIRGKMRGE